MQPSFPQRHPQVWRPLSFLLCLSLLIQSGSAALFAAPSETRSAPTSAQPVSTQASPTQAAPLTLRCADIDDSSTIGINDIVMVSAHWGSQLGDSTWEARFDLDGNGAVTIDDIVAAASTWEGSCLPPDPQTVATPLNGSVPSNFANATAFLYSGPQAIQTGVVTGTITTTRVAVLRGKVLTRDGDPLSGVTITIKDHPEFGQTLSRADGLWDLAVNGGDALVVNYEREGYLPAQRSIEAPWQDYAWLPDVVLIPVDAQVTTVNLQSSEPIQVARGSVVSDTEGTRQATLLIPAGTSAEIVLANGVTQTLSTLNVRATEYTVGDNGPETMPGELPPTSGYTYALEYSVDEAMAAGAVEVRFSQPLFHYVENFLGFPTGMSVPMGYYDREKAAWVPSENGRVIKVLAISGGLAEVDTDGDNVADNGAALGMTTAEREELATLYGAGQSLWRVPITHFTPWDCNWPYGPPDDARGPDQSPPLGGAGDDAPCVRGGSIIGCQDQVLGEVLPVAGTTFALHYSSDRVPGRLRDRTLKIPLSAGGVPNNLRRIVLHVQVAGRLWNYSFAPQSNLVHTFTWDGKDAYGRMLQGTHPAEIKIGYVYGAVYRTPSQLDRAFARYGEALSPIQSRMEVVVWQTWQSAVTHWDERARGLGGWTLDIHQAHDPVGDYLYTGDGERRATLPTDYLVNFAGDPNSTVSGNGDGGPARIAKLSPLDVEVGPDGTVYAVHGQRIRAIGPDGVIRTIAGIDRTCWWFQPCGDGGPATAAQFGEPYGLAVGPDGTVYVADRLNHKIRSIGTDGIIRTVVGTGQEGFGGDGGPATEARLDHPNDLAVGPDGSLYIADTNNHRIRRVGPDGLISTIVGTGVYGFGGDGGLATLAKLQDPGGVALGADGSLYIADTGNHRIREVGPDGIITTAAGTGATSEYGRGRYGGDGGPATAADLNGPVRVSVGPDGSLYITDIWNHRIRQVRPDGIMVTIVGSIQSNQRSIWGPWPSQPTYLFEPMGAVIGPDNALYVADYRNMRIARVGPPTSWRSRLEYAVPSTDGLEVYVFDNGRHVRTVDGLTGALRYAFDYDTRGFLASVTDGYDQVTMIERDGSGKPLAIVAPGGQRTALTVGTQGMLRHVGYSQTEVMTLTHTADGLLTELTTPRGDSATFGYDPQGMLVSDKNPAGGLTTLSRVETSDGYTVTVTTAGNRQTVYGVLSLPAGETLRTRRDPSGATTEVRVGLEGHQWMSAPNGVRIEMQSSPDPRWGAQLVIPTAVTMTQPSGKTLTRTLSRQATLSLRDDPLSLIELTDTINLGGAVSKVRFQRASRTITRTSAEGRQTSTTLNVQGAPVQRVLSAGVEPIFSTYDDFGRLVHQAQGDGFWEYTYNGAHQVETRTDALGSTVRFAFDSLGRVLSTTLPSNYSYTYRYDGNGNRTLIQMPDGVGHTLESNGLNEPVRYTPPGNAAYLHERNAYREITRFVLPGGRQVAYLRDLQGRLTDLQYPEATVHFSTTVGSGDSQLAAVTRTPAGGGATQAIDFGYDGELVTSATWSGPVAGRFDYTYDNRFRLSGITLTSGGETRETSVGYDNDDLPTTYGPYAIQRGGPGGAPSLITDGTLSAETQYDALARPITQTHRVGGQIVYELGLGYDLAGRIIRKGETVGAVTSVLSYTYDLDGQLTHVFRDGTLAEAYTYDARTNRSSRQVAGSPLQSASYDTQDRLTGQGGVSYTFNADGFLAQRGGDTFSYTAQGELVSATLQGGAVITYGYDGLHRRVSRTDGSGTTQYLYGNPNNVFQVTATRSPAGVLTTYFYDEEARLFAMERGGARFGIATDQVGTPRVISNAAGEVVKVLAYDSFGVPMGDSAPAWDLPFGFAGGLADPATGLVRFGLRDYDPLAGRWTARDPVFFNGGQFNLYVYVANNPINLRDPSGLWCIGGSVYEGVGGGVQYCRDDEGDWSLCVEVGFGVGLDVGIDTEGVQPPGSEIGAELKGGCGGSNLGIGVKFDECGLDATPKIDLGPLSSDKGKDGIQLWIPELSCEAQGKVYGKVCESSKR